MPLQRSVPYFRTILYDGTNGAEILSLLPAYEYGIGLTVEAFIVSEEDDTLSLRMIVPDYGTMDVTVSVGQGLQFPPVEMFPLQSLSSISDQQLQFIPEPSTAYIATELLGDQTFIDAILAQVSAPALYTAVGRAALPAMLLGGTSAPVVVFDSSMPDTNYQVRWRAVSGSTVLGSVVSNGAMTKTTSQVTVPLRASGLASIAGVLLVEVFQLAAS